jgi:Protein of unknown function (DUF2442)
MSASAKEVRFDDYTMWVELQDGRTLGVPLAWFQRMHFEISAGGLHWDALDEDISVEGLLAGRGDMTHRPARAA